MHTAVMRSTPIARWPFISKANSIAEQKPIIPRLRYFFDYLDAKEPSIGFDALREFAAADTKDVIAASKELPADRIVKALEDKETPQPLLGLYGSLLGYTGDSKHAEVLKKFLADPQKREISGVDGVLAGYALLDPKAGWEHIREILNDPNEKFLTRYAALRAVRFLWEYNRDLIGKDKLVAAVSTLVDQWDISDLAIDDLRKWGQWQATEKVLSLYEKKSHAIPIVKRGIIRYALSAAPANKAAAAFIAEREKDSAELIADSRELLALEEAAKKPAPMKTTSK